MSQQKGCLISIGVLALVVITIFLVTPNKSTLQDDEEMEGRMSIDIGVDTDDGLEDGPPIYDRARMTPDQVCQKERKRVAEHIDLLNKVKNGVEVKRGLHGVVMNVLQTGCRQLMRIGGRWFDKFMDGHKYICFDDLEADENCLIYSFGLGGDTSFENEMAQRGCEVHGFDHTVSISDKGPNASYNNPMPGLHLYKVAANDTSNADLPTIRSQPNLAHSGNFYVNLADALKQNGHWDRKITYLKMDIEGSEITCIPQWLSSGALRNVKQIAMEMHTRDKSPKIFADMTISLYKQGFVTIMWDPNLVVGKDKSGFYPLFEILFRKTDVCVA